MGRLASPRPLAAILPRLRPHAVPLIVAFVCLVAAAAAGLWFPRVVQDLLDSAFQARDGAQLNRVTLGLLGLFAAQAVFNFVQVSLLHGTGEQVIAALRTELFAHLVRLSPSFFADRRSGELTSRLSSDLALLQQFVSSWLGEMARQTMFLVGGVVLLTLTNPRLTLTTLAVSPVIVGTAILFGRALKRATTGVQDQVAEAMGHADEAFGQIRTVQGFVREAGETARFSSALSQVVSQGLKRARIRGAFFGFVGFVAFAGVVAVLWQGGQLVLAGGLSPGGLVGFLLYAITIASAVAAIASAFGNLQEAAGAATRVFELLATAPEVAEPVPARTLPTPVRGAVSLDDVRFRYGAELPDVLQGISLDIAPGEVVALVGASGAGKSTLAALLPRFWDVTGGAIRLDGVDVRELAFASLRGSIGSVPQDPALFSGTVRENIAYARPDASDAEVEAAATAAHAAEFIARLPTGYATRVGERGVKLSGGQRQRIAIARVFLMNPAVLVLDEATSALDSESERLVEDALATLLTGRTTVIIAHRLSTVQRANRVVVLDQGRIIETGTHDALLAADGAYARLYRGQFRD
jgi:subfamily B ATP-binding cassette protein MsbA